MKEAGLSGFDRFLGSLLGLVKGGLIVTVILMGLTAFTPTSQWLEKSRVGAIFLGCRKGGDLGGSCGF